MAVPKFEPGDTPGYLYEMMANHLAARIEAGELTPNTPLPSERRLADEYGVSLGTARHATRLLRYRGLVITIRSKGTYVADSRRSVHNETSW
ncbi:winged helix-turn-helix domain-containing protein [Amycolatopsis acididurans]|uniref:winged helix-turn-helix domain-containing protein n=1 Tax=Amycolatopsis acididurans TaxID=2724524 RepID=UPI0028B1F8F5|nr:winged helix-turn-helix domain-containing protein [Amycolatopsis acididurans]